MFLIVYQDPAVVYYLVLQKKKRLTQVLDNPTRSFEKWKEKLIYPKRICDKNQKNNQPTNQPTN